MSRQWPRQEKEEEEGGGGEKEVGMVGLGWEQSL